MSTPDVEQYLTMYQQMLKIRLFEEQVNELYTSAKMPGLADLYSGEEAVAVGVCEALRRDDYITSTHRGHGHCLAKGATVDKMFAELLGKEAGYCHGKGGSMHIADQDTGNLGANAIVGGSAAIATGAAFSSKRLGQNRVAVCFFGEGALGQGLLYESMNMAQLWKLPVLYVCENNLYNEYTHHTETTAGSMKGRAEAFGIHTREVNGQDVRAVFETAQELVARARRATLTPSPLPDVSSRMNVGISSVRDEASPEGEGEGGPAFLLCNTYRYYGHHVGDINRAYYRAKEEEQQWRTERDPLQLLAKWLIDEGMAEAAVFEQIERDVAQEIQEGVEFALNAPFPKAEEVTEDVYA